MGEDKILELQARAQDPSGRHTSRSNSSRCIRRLGSRDSLSFILCASRTRISRWSASLGSLRGVRAGATQGKIEARVDVRYCIFAATYPIGLATVLAIF